MITSSPSNIFDQAPKGIWKHPRFKPLTSTEAKLILYLIGKQDWITHSVTVPNMEALAMDLGVERHAASLAVTSLTLSRIIFATKDGYQTRIKLLFPKPAYLINRMVGGDNLTTL